ncbi:MAG: cation-translocating P-type ATPase [Blautia sp.]|nr:cation-translocating P-type ATPase [Blautia sp.]
MTGLTNGQIQERISLGQVNARDDVGTRSYKQILRKNILTFFNFLNLVLCVMVLAVGSIKNATFMGVILFNTVIGIIQEVRAKQTLDNLEILTEKRTVVLREGKKWKLATEKLVMDDIVCLKTGDQVPADATVIEGSLEVNESLLTGEADNLVKNVNDELYSGSFVTAGEAYCRIIHVGKDNYASKITSEVKEFKNHNSELRNSLNAILKIISIIIVPLGAILFYKQYVIIGDTLRNSVISTVAAVIGMIPEGLILLTSIALTLGAVRLAQKKTLVQELYCIETLARVDTICLDKTGTITSGTMQVEGVEPFWENSIDGIEEIMGNLMSVLNDSNATADALHRRFQKRRNLSLKQVIPFSSDRKFSGAVFENTGTYLIGAAQFLFPDGNEALFGKCKEYAQDGFRVLVLARSEEEMQDKQIPGNLSPIGLILLSDVIRKEAPDTLAYFYEQGVDIKVISGDDPTTVSCIAQKAGLRDPDKCIDATTLLTREDMEKAVRECNVFGRVTPNQKKEMVKILKAGGHTVAMTGDGVNDVLALKEADCSIAMAEGSDAAKNIANIVLLESDFSVMPDIVNQGRRVINNIRTAASMFLIKTIFSVFLAVLTIFFGDAYPFQPIQMSLISACAVGIPTFILAQENNYSRIDNTFLRHVFMNAFPAAITITGSVFTIMIVCSNVYHSLDMLNTACVLVTGWNYMAALKTVYNPLNRFRKIVIYGMQVSFFLAAVCFQRILALGALEFGMLIWVFILMTFSPLLIEVITARIKRMYQDSLDSGKPGRFISFVELLRR